MMRAAKVAILAMACGLNLVSLPANAGNSTDETSELASLLSTPVYAASKYQQSVADAPAAVTIITQGEIRAFGWRTLAEALNAVRGVYTRNDKAYSYVGVRGLGRPGDYSSRLLLLVDGARVNDNLYDSVMTGRESPLDIELIERIEFIPGPGSAVHGSNSVLGTINLITRSAANMRGVQAVAALDTQQGWKLGASATSEHEAGALLLATTVELRPGQTQAFPEFATPDNPYGKVRGQDRESAARVFARFGADNWSAELLAGRRAREIPNAPFGLVFGDPAAEWVDSLGVASFSWHPAEIDGEGWYSQLSVGRYTYGDYGRYEPDQELVRYSNLGVWAHGELNRKLRLGERHLVLLGMDVQQDLTQEFRMHVLEPASDPVLQYSAHGTRLGLYASDDITLTEHWRLGVGARLDRDAHDRWTGTPRLSLLWRPTEKVSLKALAGEAYRNPNVYEAVPDGSHAGWNDDLHRERTSARELAVDWQYSADLRFSASAYRYDVSDMIEQVIDSGTGGLVFANVSSARAHGIELETEYLVPGGLRIRSSIASQKARNAAGDRLTNSPGWLAKLHATAPVPATPLRAAVELQGMGHRNTEAGARLSAQWLTNLSLGWNSPGQRWSASFTIHNAFDRHVYDPTSTEYLSDRVAQDRREATLRLYFTF